jgi:pyruvate/2-oxoglutarate dehydrogenase complex dihydrolipoamide acyltransferase (E2) component
MPVSASDSKTGENSAAGTTTPIPKRITNAQTVCNERNEKGKLCNGHLKQLRTAGEPAEVHLRGDDVLFKCQTCGTLYMGPPLGHVRDPGKQHRFVEAELTALLQAAGGTLPVIKKNERGVFVLVESAPGGHSVAKEVAAKPAATPAVAEKKPAAVPPAVPTAPKPAAAKGEAQPDRKLMRRYTYSGVTDIGPVPGESFAQKVERLKALAAAAKRRADESGSVPAASAPTQVAEPVENPATATSETQAAVAESESETVPVAESASPTAPPPAQSASGSGPDRTLFRRSTYGDVVDTGPVPGETFEQKVERLRALSAAAKQRSEGG